MDCEYCDGEGYVPCEECNDIPIQVVAKPIETPLEVHKKEVRYWKLELTLQERLTKRVAVASFVDDAGLTLALALLPWIVLIHLMF